MSWLTKAALFALKEAAGPALRNVGQAIGERLGRVIDPKGADARARANAGSGDVEAPEEEEEEDDDDSGKDPTSLAG